MTRNNWLDSEISPYKSFTLILAICVGMFGILLIVTAGWVVKDYIVTDTANLTTAAIRVHFSELAPLAGAFAKPAGEGGKAAPQPVMSSQHASHAGAYAGGMGAPVAVPDQYESLEALAKMHFGLYKIETARFYDPEGTVTFSYDPAEIGTNASEADQAFFAGAKSGKTDRTLMKDNKLRLWIPIMNKSGKLDGVVELERDISGQTASIKRIVIALLSVILPGMLVLFLSLRKIFILSTRTIDNKNKELGELIAAVERTYDQSLQALSSALDSRDNETQGHSFRVTAYAVRLGREMGLSTEEIGMLARGALLHDVGKIGIPDAILLKNDRLNESEYKAMQDHVHLGYRVLQNIEFLKPSLDVVKYHHERWEGNGYPHGLGGEEIPLFARIFSLCDSFDAITSDRPYRKGNSYAYAREEIIRCRGTQFAPDVVDAFLRIPEEDWMHFDRLSQDPILLLQRNVLAG